MSESDVRVLCGRTVIRRAYEIAVGDDLVQSVPLEIAVTRDDDAAILEAVAQLRAKRQEILAAALEQFGRAPEAPEQIPAEAAE